MAYRANFLFFWFCANGAYFIFILVLAEVGNTDVINDGTLNILTGFAIYLASIVVFRVTFALCYVCKWNCRYCCNKKYQFPEINLEAKFKEYKKQATTGEESTDDEEILAQAKSLFKKNEKKIRAKAHRAA